MPINQGKSIRDSVMGYGFQGQGQVAVFGPARGAHARSAVGLAELPFRIPVEIEGEVELKSSDA